MFIRSAILFVLISLSACTAQLPPSDFKLEAVASNDKTFYSVFTLTFITKTSGGICVIDDLHLNSDKYTRLTLTHDGTFVDQPLDLTWTRIYDFNPYKPLPSTWFKENCPHNP